MSVITEGVGSVNRSGQIGHDLDRITILDFIDRPTVSLTHHSAFEVRDRDAGLGFED